ncbi:MAG: ATP-dependent RecD-like DNA helicase [Bacillota bacterium]
MIIEGSVERIAFRNEENGYTVIDFYADNKVIPVVGIFPMICVGETLSLVGEYVTKGIYGEQFSVKEVVYKSPTDKFGIINYLSSGLFKGVGISIATSIFETFGTDTLKVMENTPDKLSKVRGISAKRAVEIGIEFGKHIDMQHTLIFLQQHGITLGQSLKIYKKYGANTEEQLLDNPYKLVEDIEGIGFTTADKMAGKFGIDSDSEFRIMAGITHILQEGASREGHTCMPYDMVVDASAHLLGVVDTEKVASCIAPMLLTLRLKKHSITINNEDVEMLALPQFYATEGAIAMRLMRLISAVETVNFNLEKDIARYEHSNDILLHEAQKKAIETAISSGVMVITGGPGTGKTTIIKCITELFMSSGKRVKLCAPTGRAAKRMSEATGLEAKTIHRLLGMEFAEGKFNFKYNELEPLDADVVIVDEISMADIFIFNSLIKALEMGTRIVLVGDKDQLPSVSAGNILGDIIACNMVPVIALTEIYRQDANSLIISNAHRINNGEMPVLNNASKDFFVDDKIEPETISDTAIAMYTSRLPKYFNIAATDIQVLTPVKKTVCGVEALNANIQKIINPVGSYVTCRDTIFRVGDKVMQIVNDYDLEWTREDGFNFEEGKGVFNGDIGFIKDINKDTILVKYDDNKIVRYKKDKHEELNLAYAISVHKSQGSEFKVVLLVLAKSYRGLLTRNLLYTAVTRAKEAVVIVGNPNTILSMVHNNVSAKRYTLLKDLLEKGNARMGKILHGE